VLTGEAANLLNHLATAVVVFDAQFRLVEANLTAETLLATSITKLRGLHAERLFPLGETFCRAWNDVMRDGRSFTERNVSLLRPNQEHVSVECTVSPWWRTGATPAGVILELSSNERHHRIQAEENRLLQNQISTTLMRGLAHEVKNPLGGIRGAAQLLERELDDPRQREYTQIIIGEADRLRKLVDRMLGPRSQLQLANHNIHEILEHVRQVVEIETSTQVHFHRDYDPSLPDFLVDRDLLVQAFLNLVRNGVQAVNGHGGNITLRTRAQRQLMVGKVLHRLVLHTEIEDDGPGVAPEIKDSIFFPMVSGRADGSGLGLPIAQSLVQRHGGLIECNTAPGKTVFTVLLPARNKI
jgi:two-component system, NtrC family, nitrogen regulation sensor histidine kinase GlnL